MLYAIFSRASGLRQSRTQSMPVRRLGAGHAQHLTCERAYSGYEIGTEGFKKKAGLRSEWEINRGNTVYKPD